VARNGARGGGRGLLVLVVAGVGFCDRLMAWPVEVASLKARRGEFFSRWRGMVNEVGIVGGCSGGRVVGWLAGSRWLCGGNNFWKKELYFCLESC